jgi:hypothetical protein
MQILDLTRFHEASVTDDPFEFLVLPGFIRREFLAEIGAGFPRIDRGGSFPLTSLCYGESFGRLADELLSDDLRTAFAEKFALDLSQRPATMTVRGCCRSKDGKIHTDSRSKLITALVYLNDAWESPGGRLRLLRSKDINDVITEVAPDGGTLVCFRNRQNAWHGHTPFEGVRRAMQLNWVTDEAAARKTERRHGRSAFWKRLVPSRAS